VENSGHARFDLGNIATQWSLVRRAHDGSLAGSGAAARHALVLRYAPAIRRFVQVVVRDPQLADELSQDAMVRLLKGDFSGADPGRGRFRDLLKTAIRNMARNHWAREKRRTPAEFDMDLLAADSGDAVQRLDDQWAAEWKDNLMDVVWDRLRDWEQEQPGSVAWTVLRLRAEWPEDSSAALAARLSEATGREYRADAVRQQLRRARVRFVEFLVEEIAHGLPDATPDALRDELESLGLLASVRDVLPEEWR
jgi:RNA polymerase sigma factor (sigma-70 family)